MRQTPLSYFKDRFPPDIHQASLNARLMFQRILFLVMFSFLLHGCTPNQAKVYRIGILSGMTVLSTITDGYQEKMEELGYVEGKNVEYDEWNIDDNPEEEERIIQKFIDDRVDLILTYPSRPTILAKNLTKETGIPVVFAGATIEGTNLVDSLREPGRNITGVRFPSPELTAKRLELLLELVPDAQRILIFYDENYPSYTVTRQALDSIIKNTKATIVAIPVSSVEEVKSYLGNQGQKDEIDVDAIFLVADLISASADFWETIKSFALTHHLPVACNLEFQLEDPCLFILNSSHTEIGKLAAVITDKIMRGTPPGSIPVSSPELDLYINYRWAQTLGLTVPEGLLKQANKVIR